MHLHVHTHTHMHTVICKCRQMLLHTICKSFLKINNYLKMERSFKAGAVAPVSGCLGWFCGRVLKGGEKLFLMASRSYPNSEWGNDRSFFDRFLLKTQVPAGSLAFLRRLQAVRESDPWAPFLCLTRRWHHVNQEMVQRFSLKRSGGIHKMAQQFLTISGGLNVAQ